MTIDPENAAFVNPPATADVPSRRVTRVATARAHPERVWRAISEASELAAWLGDIATFPAGITPGATGRIAWTGEIVLAVEILKVEPGRRLEFAWAEGFMSEAASRVSISLKPDEHGTLIHLEETGFSFPADDNAQVLSALRSLAQGWTLELDELIAYVEQNA